MKYNFKQKRWKKKKKPVGKGEQNGRAVGNKLPAATITGILKDS